MKKLLRYFFLLPLLLVTACSDDDEPVDVPLPDDEEEEVLITSESGTTVINTKDVVLGESDDDLVFTMTSSVLTTSGLVEETTLNCCAMGATALDFTDDMPKVDGTRTVENVTMINRGTITVHTKQLVERYKDVLRTTTDNDRPYTYLRLLVMYAGANSTIINEGVINIYFDHDPSVTSTIYVMGMIAGEGSSMINNGEIHFYGTGSVATRVRGMATFGDNISALNTGTMTADVEMTEDARLITTGGSSSNVINDGIMRMRVPGMVLCMTRYGNSNIINNNLVDVTLVDMPEGYSAVGNGAYPVACAMYDPLPGMRSEVPPMVNRGTINIAIEGTERMSPSSQAYGMYCDLMSAGGSKVQVNVINDGKINVSQSGPRRYNVAEAGFITRSQDINDFCNIKLGRWKTTLRDYSQTRDLFLARGAVVDFSGGELVLEKVDEYVDGTAYSVAPEDLVYNAGGSNYSYELYGYPGLKFSSASDSITLNWDKENRTVSLD